MKAPDIFTTLAKYDEPENRFTAALVHLLKYLGAENNSPETQNNFWSAFLSGCEIDVALNGKVNLEMQKSEIKVDGRNKIIPDLQIYSNDVLIWIEVKDTADVTQNLQDYKNKLENIAKESGFKDNRLVLLRHNYISPEKCLGVDHDITWSKLYSCLNRVNEEGFYDRDSVSYYLLGQFLLHLKEKGVMVVDKINGENVIVGSKDLASLFVIIQEMGKQLFNTKGFGKFKVSRITCDSDNICFWFDKGSQIGKYFTLEIDPSYPSCINMGMKLDNTVLTKKDKQLLRKNIANGKLKPDDDGFVYSEGKLDSMYCQVNPKKDQSDELYRILDKMFSSFT